MTARSTNESAIDSLLLRMPSLLVTRTVSGLEATVMRISNSHERIPTSVNSARSTVVITADKSKTTLTTEIPAMRAVLLQLVFCIAGAQSFREQKTLTKLVDLVLLAWYGANIVGHGCNYSLDSEDLQDEQA
jgi:hypothetical protein